MMTTNNSSSSANITAVLAVAATTTVGLLTAATTLYLVANKKKVVFSSSKSSSSNVDFDDNNNETGEENDGNVVVVKLDDHDLLLLKFDIRPVTTLTWFRGNYREDDVVVSNLRQRAKQILSKNPWLAGKLVLKPKYGERKRPCIVYPKDKNKIDEFDPITVVEESKSPISRYDTPLEDLECIARIHGLALSKNHPDEPLWKIIVVACSKEPTNYFAIIMSMSHIVAGGSTYYDILTMLLSSNNDTTILSLDIQRVPNYKEQIQPLEESNFGRNELNFPSTPQFVHVFLFGMLRSFLSSKIFQRKVQQIYILIDNDKIDDIKRQWQAESSDNDNDDDNTRKVSYITTNDILVSWFYNTSLTTYGFMNVDCRINGIFSPRITLQHAGNYQRLIYYDTQYDSTTPTLIRRSLQVDPLEEEQQPPLPPPLTTTNNGGDRDGTTKEATKRKRKLQYQRAITYDQPLPSYTKCVLLGYAHFGMSTNWASFLSHTQELHIPNTAKTNGDDSCCKQELHIPLTDVSTFMPYTFTELLIFRPYPGKIAVRISGYRLPSALRHPPFASSSEEEQVLR